jgi:hypothetical protein
VAVFAAGSRFRRRTLDVIGDRPQETADETSSDPLAESRIEHRPGGAEGHLVVSRQNEAETIAEQRSFNR